MKKLLFAALMLAACSHKIKQPVYIEYYKPGEILLPDYACQDTLIVVDAKGLNEGMGYIEQGFIDASDGNIDSILHTFCKIK